MNRLADAPTHPPNKQIHTLQPPHTCHSHSLNFLASALQNNFLSPPGWPYPALKEPPPQHTHHHHQEAFLDSSSWQNHSLCMPATHTYHMLSVLLFAFLDPPGSHLGADSFLYLYSGWPRLLLNECENKMGELIPKSYLQPQIWEVTLL